MTRWIGRSIVILLLASVLLLSVTFGLVATEAGSRWLIGQLLSFAGVPVEIEGVSGRLLTELRLQRIHYSSETVRLAANDVAIDPTWLEMLWNERLMVERLVVGSVAIVTTPADQSDTGPPTLPASTMTIDIASAEVRKLTVNDVDSEFLPSLAAALRWDDRALTIQRLHAAAPRYTLDGDATLTTGARLVLNGSFRGTASWPSGDTETSYEGSVELSGPIDSLRIEGSLTAPWTIAFEGAVEPLRADPLVAIDLTGRDLQWQGYRAATLDVHVAGTRNVYAGRVSGRVATPYEIEGSVRADFSGDDHSLRFENADLQSNVGAAAGSAEIVWSPSLSAEFAGSIRNANPQTWGPEMAGDIDAHVAAIYKDATLELAIDDVSGELASRPIAGRADVRVHDGTVELERAELTSGTDRVAGSGRWRRDEASLSATFALSDVAVYVPQLAGDASGTIDVTRSASGWFGKGSATSRQLRYSGVRMTQVTIDGERSPQDHTRLRARAAAASLGEIELTRLVLDASGPDDKLVVTVSASAPTGESSMNATLRIVDDSVDATVASGASLALAGGAWRLRSPMRVEVATGSVQVSSHCWRAADASLCVDGLRWQDDRIDSKGKLDGLPVSVLAWLDPALEGIRGTVDGHWSLERRGTEWGGLAELATVGLRYDPELVQGDEVVLPPVRATLALRQSGATAVLTIGADESQMVTARVRTHGYDADTPIEGRVNVAIADLTRLSTLSERAAKTKGRIVGELSIAGTLRTPTVTGHIRLEGGALEWQEPHLDLSRIELDIALQGDGSITIGGSARSRDSNLRANGTVTDVLSGARRLKLSLTSDPVAVAMPDMEVTIVPAIELDWSSEAASLTGSVRVPTARIKVSRLPEGATARSDDVVVEGREDVAVSATTVEADLAIELGDDVRLTAFGLETRLTGSLRLRQPKRGPLLLFGRIDLAGGSYSAYGRSLAIESGRLLFQGPADDPDVDVRATRKIERPEPEQNVTAGVHVRGHATALESTLFADPPMAESDALSYLVMGRPLNQTTANEGEDLSGIAMALGLAQATGIVNQIRTRIGLDELGAGTSAAQETTVIAGKQVASKLYARYTYNTFTRLSALLLRYDLTRKLSLEATAGEAPGMDMIYRVGSD